LNRRCWTSTIVKELRVQDLHLGRQLAFESFQLRVPGDEGQDRRFCQSRSVIRNDQLMAFVAGRPITDTLTYHTTSSVTYEIPRRVPPHGVGRGAEITQASH
jgi:hypothetical protein